MGVVWLPDELDEWSGGDPEEARFLVEATAEAHGDEDDYGEEWGDRCGRCGERLPRDRYGNYMTEVAEVVEVASDGYHEHIIVHVGCMKEGEEIA